MSRYLFQVSYTAASWKAQVESTANVIDRVKPVLTACNGTMESLDYAFGTTDLFLIADFPAKEDAIAFSLAVTAGGALTSITTTPLISVEEGMEGMRRAAAVSGLYVPPVRA